MAAFAFESASPDVLIRNLTVEKKWVWGADILVAASQDVEVHDNAVAVSVGGCGIVLVDQTRRIKGGGKYKTRNNTVRNNEMFFEGVACAGGASDVEPGNENFAIITDGNNLFDGNVYRVPRTSGRALRVGACDFRLGRASRKRSGIEGSTGGLLTIRASVATQ